MITLNASADFGLTGQYIARINGRDSKYTFNREFIGRKLGKRNESSQASVDDVGLYECCNIKRKHGKSSRYVVVIEVDDELVDFTVDKEEAMTIAKAMDSGRPFSEIVVAVNAPVFQYEILTAKQAENRKAEMTIEAALNDCWKILQNLTLKDAKEVLTALKKKINPPN